MITRAVLDERVREWGLRDDVVEKDYGLGWLLWGIGSNKLLGDSWVFKGGTCLKKCYIETYRFSEDLDFTVLPDGPIDPEDVLPLIGEVLNDVNEASGIDFSVEEPRLKLRPGGRTAEGRVYYRGPRGAPQPARIKLDLSADEILARPPVLRPIAHAYPDELPAPAEVRCYGFEELFAEKIRAMGERSRPRDLYDIRFHDLRHTFGTRMAAAGAPLRNIQEWMGHRDHKTTEIYADYAPDPVQGARWAEAAFPGGDAEDEDATDEENEAS